jgi:hypothetical protein
MMGGLEVYAAVKQNRDKAPGLNVAAGEMAVFFQKPGKKITALKTTGGEPISISSLSEKATDLSQQIQNLSG